MAAPEAFENSVFDPPAHERLDAINDDMHCLVRLIGKPETCMSAPEIMDALRLGFAAVMSRYHALAAELRRKAQNEDDCRPERRGK